MIDYEDNQVEIDEEAAFKAVKQLVIEDKLSLQCNGKSYSMVDFGCVLLVESEEYIAMCEACLSNKPFDFESTFHAVLDRWIGYTVNEMTGRELHDAIDSV